MDAPESPVKPPPGPINFYSTSADGFAAAGAFCQRLWVILCPPAALSVDAAFVSVRPGWRSPRASNMTVADPAGETGRACQARPNRR